METSTSESQAERTAVPAAHSAAPPPHDFNPIADGPPIAAGGVVRDKEGRIAVVQRTVYEDWCLPKGKPRADETLLLAAVREVGEETGCSARAVRFAGSTVYPVEDGAKVVFFWDMECAASTFDRPDPREIRRVKWLKPTSALLQLTHPEERQLIEAVCMRKLSPPPAERQRRWWPRFQIRSRSSNEVRLAASLLTIQSRMEENHRTFEERNSCRAGRAWMAEQRKLFERAVSECNHGWFEEAWQCLSAQQQMEVLGYDEPRIAQEVIVLRHEAAKLSSWRRQSVLDLTDPVPLQKLPLSARRRRVMRAMQIRDDHFNNQYKQVMLLREQVALLALVLGLVLALLLSIDLAYPIIATSSNAPMLVYAAMFGALGGALSGAWSLNRGKASIPERIVNWPTTLARPLLGAAAGVAVIVLFGSNLSSVPGAVLGLAFAAGFTERIILSAVGREQAEQPREQAGSQ
jgi:8-oxo-dGTP diphosphatase